MQKSSIITALVLVGIAVVVGVFTFRSDPSTEGLSDAERVFKQSEVESPYTDLSGNSFSLSQYEGKVRVINAWASWCPFCVEELPDFDTLAKEYNDKNVVVIAINRKESKDTANNFLKSISSTDNIIFALDPRDIFHKSIGGFSMPETIFYDTSGNIVVHKRGFMSLEEMRQHTNETITASSN